jgi:hypothetical protein
VTGSASQKGKGRRKQKRKGKEKKGGGVEPRALRVQEKVIMDSEFPQCDKEFIPHADIFSSVGSKDNYGRVAADVD